MKRAEKQSKPVFKNQPLTVTVTLGDGMVFDNGEVVTAEIMTLQHPAVKQAGTAKITSDNTVDISFTAPILSTSVNPGDLVAEVTFTGVSGESKTQVGIGSWLNETSNNENENRITRPVYEKDAALIYEA